MIHMYFSINNLTCRKKLCETRPSASMMKLGRVPILASSAWRYSRSAIVHYSYIRYILHVTSNSVCQREVNRKMIWLTGENGPILVCFEQRTWRYDWVFVKIKFNLIHMKKQKWRRFAYLPGRPYVTCPMAGKGNLTEPLNSGYLCWTITHDFPRTCAV